MYTQEIIFAAILEQYPNSYYAEDLEKVIIGINVSYFDSECLSFQELTEIVENQEKDAPEFVGIFSVLSAGFTQYFEKVRQPDNENYFFPDVLLAKAKAYIYYKKSDKSYAAYGDVKLEDYNSIEAYNKRIKTSKKAEIITDLIEEKQYYIQMVEKIKQYIKSGDVFQTVPSAQLVLKTEYDAFAFYLDLALNNPSPYMYYFPTPYGEVVGASPEILVQKTDDTVFVAPIAGTKRRGKDSNEDKVLAEALLADQKECAEHRMLVDLARNDVGKVSEIGTVHVENLMHIEYFQKVMHIVTDVYGKCREGVRTFDLVGATFPAGTLSGAPKIRALEIISELERVKRNIYSGGIGFFHANGDIQIAIIIRTAFFEKGEGDQKNLYIQAGSGIVYDSNAEDEYAEIVLKRAALYDLLEIKNKESGELI